MSDLQLVDTRIVDEAAQRIAGRKVATESSAQQVLAAARTKNAARARRRNRQALDAAKKLGHARRGSEASAR